MLVAKTIVTNAHNPCQKHLFKRTRWQSDYVRGRFMGLCCTGIEKNAMPRHSTDVTVESLRKKHMVGQMWTCHCASSREFLSLQQLEMTILKKSSQMNAGLPRLQHQLWHCGCVNVARCLAFISFVWAAWLPTFITYAVNWALDLPLYDCRLYTK